MRCVNEPLKHYIKRGVEYHYNNIKYSIKWVITSIKYSEKKMKYFSIRRRCVICNCNLNKQLEYNYIKNTNKLMCNNCGDNIKILKTNHPQGYFQ